jgi:hypothetical protein
MELVDAGIAVPVHFDDYPLFKSPLSDFRAEVNPPRDRRPGEVRRP